MFIDEANRVKLIRALVNGKPTDLGIHYFPVLNCDVCRELKAEHIVLSIRLMKDMSIDIGYSFYCDGCYRDGVYDSNAVII